MPESFLTIGPVNIRIFTALLTLSVLIAAGFILYRTPVTRRGNIADVLLGALIGGVVCSRAIHVALNWNHFAFYPEEMIRIGGGGLSWHGAVWGGLLGGTIVARWRGVSIRSLLDQIAFVLPLVALSTWGGCWFSLCGYGREVETLADYPPLLVWEGPDIFGIFAPRYNTQVLGVIFSLCLLIFAIVIYRRRWLRGVRFSLFLILLSIAMFALGFLRGDYSLFLAELRLDQWLDLFMVLTGFALLLLFRNTGTSERQSAT